LHIVWWNNLTTSVQNDAFLFQGKNVHHA
jgi:hypothetical protein